MVASSLRRTFAIWCLVDQALRDPRDPVLRPREHQFYQLARVDLAGDLPHPLRGFLEAASYGNASAAPTERFLSSLAAIAVVLDISEAPSTRSRTADLFE